MSTTFTLYNNLVKKSYTEVLSDEKKTEFIEYVKKLDGLGYKNLYTLIRIYQAEHEEINSQIPYDSKIQKSGLKFNLEILPTQLQNILYSFITLHMKKLEEEREIRRI
jgi:hypothetical protein